METTFANPFQLADLLVFDETHFCQLLAGYLQKRTLQQLAWGLCEAPTELIERAQRCLSSAQRAALDNARQSSASQEEIQRARQALLDAFFWELTYWKTPELYEELTAGEQLHPGIFPRLQPLLRGKVVLDAGAGSGRASFECIRYGARLVYALEPSPGLRRLLERKIEKAGERARIVPKAGDFTHIPQASSSVDLALSCSAFTAEPEQGGEAGLAELRRVVRPGGSIVLIWPRPEDRSWLAERGFSYVSLPGGQEMSVHFSSLASALRCARRFYARNTRVVRYLLRKKQPEVPFSVLGFNAPCDYCWLAVR
jgi:SAM-dependent methyltransferase